ncbi:MAG: hypothetical protein M1821_007945 [Bathelium mastoideum]|nr:MAG: hypothetical protein M1821_007945 [Bathelium mastoideum]KAI9692991.1 MAG: hypothetical protein M1822_004986 [Bathelium mastoideum]
MVATYTLFGRQVGSHVLAMATLGTFFATGAYFSSGGKKEAQQTPPINATSKDEENFIQYVEKNSVKNFGLTAILREFLKNADAEDKKQKH